MQRNVKCNRRKPTGKISEPLFAMKGERQNDPTLRTKVGGEARYHRGT